MRNNVFFVLGLLIPAILVFKVFFLGSPLAWGDAPFFYPEGLRELYSEPHSWTNRGENFGGVNNFLWLYPLMFVYGTLYKLLGLGNDAIIRIIFYFPAVLLSIISPIVFVRYLGYSKIVQFFASLLYTFNTYFLLLIDGGQVGIALAYGIFPLTLLYLRKLVDSPHIKTFFVAVWVFVLLTIVDPRIAAISIVALIVWVVIEEIAVREGRILKNLRFLLLLGIVVIGLAAYWIIPLLGTSGAAALDVSRLQLLSLLNPLFLFQPHWPLNEFGKVAPPPFYFVGIPLLIFGSLLFPAKSKHLGGPAIMAKPLGWAFCILLFAFISKGGNPPLGGWYEWMVANVPFGVALRDTSKFFAPLILFSGILLGLTVDNLNRIWAGKRFIAILILALVYIYLLFLVHPALLGPPAGGLHGVLAGRQFTEDFRIIHQKLSGQEGFFRTAWLPERYPFSFHTEEKPALEAKRLVNARPFASLNVGTYDAFNFMHKNEFLDWFELLGIKYLIFSGDPRKFQLNESEKEDWDNLLKLTATTSGIIREDWNTSFPVFRVPNIKPRIFAVDKLFVVIGGDDIYSKLKLNNEKFEIGSQAFVFVEDGKLDPRSLLDAESAFLIFNDKDEIDLTLSFLQKYFIKLTENVGSRWAIRDSRDFLRWKFEFLINNIPMKEFDYGKGVAFSTQENEEMLVALDIPAEGEYMFAVHSLTRSLTEKATFNLFYEEDFPYRSEGRFEWFIKGPLKLTKGERFVLFKNVTGFHAINTVALIPKRDWDESQELTRQLINNYKVAKQDLDFPDGKWQEVAYEKGNPTRYKVKIPQDLHWLIFTDSYHPKWKIERKGEFFSSYPFYSMINGFYLDSDREVEIVFGGQEEVRWGLYFSAVSILLLAVIFLWQYAKRNR